MKKGFRKGFALTALASLASLTACGQPMMMMPPQGAFFRQAPGQFSSFNASAQARPGKKWTIATHMAADNNLYSAGLDDINEMEAGLASDAVDVIVLFDGLKKGDSKIYRIKRDPQGYNQTIISEELNDGGAVIPPSKEIDSGDPKVFYAFVDWVTKNFPSEKNSISIWNHGSGVFRGSVPGQPLGPVGDMFDTLGGRPKTRGMTSKSFASDDSGGEMHLRDLNPALANGAKNLGKPFDILGFDACLMGYMETAYQAKGLANVLVASEELEPGDGWDYHAYLAGLSQNPNANAAELGHIMVDTYGKSYRPGGSQRGRDITLSAININALTNVLVPAVNNLALELTNSLSVDKESIKATRNSTQTFYNSNSADLGDFVKRLSAVPSRDGRLQAAAANVQQAMSQTVISETHYGTPVANATGIQVYFPRDYQGYNQRYDDPQDILFGETQAWGKFLKAYTGK